MEVIMIIVSLKYKHYNFHISPGANSGTTRHWHDEARNCSVTTVIAAVPFAVVVTLCRTTLCRTHHELVASIAPV